MLSDLLLIAALVPFAVVKIWVLHSATKRYGDLFGGVAYGAISIVLLTWIVFACERFFPNSIG